MTHWRAGNDGSGANAATYTPTDRYTDPDNPSGEVADVTRYLRLTASYDDDTSNGDPDTPNADSAVAVAYKAVQAEGLGDDDGSPEFDSGVCDADGTRE